MRPTRLQFGKPVIAAIEGPAVVGGMELAIWADCRVMAEGAYMGVYNRRWVCRFRLEARSTCHAWWPGSRAGGAVRGKLPCNDGIVA